MISSIHKTLMHFLYRPRRLTPSTDHPATKLIEARSQIASAEAMAYADHSVGSLSKSLSASNRVLIGAMKRISELETAVATLANDVKSSQTTLSIKIAAIEEKFGNDREDTN